MMTIVRPGQELAAAADDFGAEMFELLWGHERGTVSTAVDQAYELIWKQLIRGEAQGGARLSDVALAERFALSRTPIRQALQRLAQEGLVQIDPNRGFFVRTVS